MRKLVAPTPGNHALLAQLNEINAALALEHMAELDPLKRGAGNISYVADRVDGLVGLGAAGSGSHAPGETAELSSFGWQIKRAIIDRAPLRKAAKQPGHSSDSGLPSANPD